MKTAKRVLLLIVLMLNCILVSACWNYREIEQMSIVVGVAVDKVQGDQFLVTAEVINPGGGAEELKHKSLTVEATGDTVFHTVRSMIAAAGRKTYWSHTKVLIVSRVVADTDMISVLDWIARDQEPREDMWIAVSEEPTAGEILKSQPKMESSIALQLDAVFRSQKTLPGFPAKRVYEFINDMASTTTNPVLPALKLMKQGNKIELVVLDTVIFKRDKIVGILDHDEGKALLFVQNSIKGGLYVVEHVGDEKTTVTLEISRNKTTVKPIYSDGKMIMKIDVKPVVSIAEISTVRDVFDKEGLDLIKDTANKKLTKEIENLIAKVQKEYESDVFGFGKKVKDKEPALWRKIEADWDETFVKIEPQVNVDFQIKGSAKLKKPLKVAD